jgi:hypothetical protein
VPPVLFHWSRHEEHRCPARSLSERSSLGNANAGRDVLFIASAHDLLVLIQDDDFDIVSELGLVAPISI